jgi:TetR/AcrR family transcriptional regulator, cholesterol catabolism regulator
MKKGISLEKERIKNVAAAFFGEKGYSATSIRDIAQELNVSVATIYYYFNNKDDLLFNIIDSNGNDLLAVLNTAKEEHSDPLEQLRRMLFGHICLIQEKKNEVKVYVEEQVNLTKKNKNNIYKQHRRIYDMYIDQLRKLKRLNLLRFESLPIVAFAMFGMVNWVYRWYRENGEKDIEEVARILIDLFFYGILVDADRTLSK